MMNKDVFENNSGKYNIQYNGDMSQNFFISQEPKIASGRPVKRLNDYDCNILKEGAYKDVSDELFKLEYEISKTEDTINSLDDQIQAARDIQDFNLASALFSEKKKLQSDLNKMLDKYNGMGMSAKISGNLTNKIKKQFLGVKQFTNVFFDFVSSLLPKRISSVLEIKKSLSKLENINKNVDELMTLQTPYGEAGSKYDRLSKYITKANYIQAEISRHLK